MGSGLASDLRKSHGQCGPELEDYQAAESVVLGLSAKNGAGLDDFSGASAPNA